MVAGDRAPCTRPSAVAAGRRRSPPADPAPTWCSRTSRRPGPNGRACSSSTARPFGLVAGMFGCTRSAPDPRRAAIGELLARGNGGDGRDRGRWGRWGPAVLAGQQLPDRRPPRIRRRPGAAEHPGDQPERPGPLQLGRPGRRHPQAAAPRLLQRVLEQPRLADAGLAVDQHDGQAAGRRPVDGVVQDRGLGLTTADTRVRGGRPRRADAQVLVRSRAHPPLGAPTEEGIGGEAAGITRK